MKKQIIAIGGGAMSKKPSQSFPLEAYILQQTEKENPRVCFLATATMDADAYIQQFYDVFNKFPCQRSHLALFNEPRDVDILMQQDVIYVGGGNTRNLLVVWQEWGLDKLLYNLYQNGTILTGFSAGSICWFEEGLSDYISSGLNAIKALGYIKGSHCPHYDSEPKRKQRYHELIKSGAMKEGIAVEDDVALHYIDGHLTHIVSANMHGKAYQIKRSEDGTQEIELRPTIYV